MSVDAPSFGESAQISVYCHPEWENDLNLVREPLLRATRKVDLLEPFERISTSLSVLMERDERFR